MDAIRLINALPAPLRWRATRAAQRVATGAVRLRFALSRTEAPELPRVPSQDEAPIRVVIGPANTAEQAYQLARSLEREVKGVSAVSVFAIEPDPYDVKQDLLVPHDVAFGSKAWESEFESFLLAQTHVINESAIPLLGSRHNADAFAELRFLEARGVQPAIVFHGSELRNPLRHRLEHAHSPFTNPKVPSAFLADRAQRNLQETRRLQIPAFVTTPDLLQDMPEAHWCPVVIEPEAWRPTTPSSGWHGRRAVVVHVPSNSAIKGSDLIEPALRRLDEAGVIEYRRMTGILYRDMPALFSEADIVLDQFLLAAYGVAACEAMAAGCVVVAHVDEKVRDVVAETAGVQVPIVEATVDDIEERLIEIVNEPDRAHAIGSDGGNFVEAVHSGEFSTRVISRALGLTG